MANSIYVNLPLLKGKDSPNKNGSGSNVYVREKNYLLSTVHILKSLLGLRVIVFSIYLLKTIYILMQAYLIIQSQPCSV